MRISVAGGLQPDPPDSSEHARLLGSAIGAAGHVLLQGLCNAFDHTVAQAALAAAAIGVSWRPHAERFAALLDTVG